MSPFAPHEVPWTTTIFHDRPSPIRANTRSLRQAWLLDEWPSRAAVVDFGIASAGHLGTLQFAVVHEGVTLEPLDQALGDEPAIQGL